MDNLMGSLKIDKSSRNNRLLAAGVLVGIVCVAGVALLLCQGSTPSSALSQFLLEEQEFQEFMLAHNKVYSEEEYQIRLQIFRDNLAYIRIQNSLNLDWVLGVNQFTDMTPQEFKAGFASSKFNTENRKPAAEFKEPVKALPTTVDWRTQGAVTAVKSQGNCDSGWAFSTTGAIEGIWKISGNPLISLSEQELLDCTINYGNKGCYGGSMDFAFDFVTTYGIALESTYPYYGVEYACNPVFMAKVAANITGYANVGANNPTALQTAVATQPISVAVEADQYVWQYYKAGIITSNCGTNLDHGVLLVGYNITSTPSYWIVKNSWGSTWGENGYLRISINAGPGVCGINMFPSYPIL